MFRHKHPYAPFIPNDATVLIAGTIPPPRFSNGTIYEDDVDFCYGSKFGLLWPILNKIYDLQLEFKNTSKAIEQRKKFLSQHKIGICDIIESCEREKNDASDLGMNNLILRDLLLHLKMNHHIEKILFMGGNSKNGPEYLFRKILKKNSIHLDSISMESPKVHEFKIINRTITTISLISPSNAANRSIGANPIYKILKKREVNYSTFDFRCMQYQKYFPKL